MAKPKEKEFRKDENIRNLVDTYQWHSWLMQCYIFENELMVDIYRIAAKKGGKLFFWSIDDEYQVTDIYWDSHALARVIVDLEGPPKFRTRIDTHNKMVLESADEINTFLNAIAQGNKRVVDLYNQRQKGNGATELPDDI